MSTPTTSALLAPPKQLTPGSHQPNTPSKRKHSATSTSAPTKKAPRSAKEGKSPPKPKPQASAGSNPRPKPQQKRLIFASDLLGRAGFMTYDELAALYGITEKEVKSKYFNSLFVVSQQEGRDIQDVAREVQEKRIRNGVDAESDQQLAALSSTEEKIETTGPKAESSKKAGDDRENPITIDDPKDDEEAEPASKIEGWCKNNSSECDHDSCLETAARTVANSFQASENKAVQAKAVESSLDKVEAWLDTDAALATASTSDRNDSISSEAILEEIYTEHPSIFARPEPESESESESEDETSDDESEAAEESTTYPADCIVSAAKRLSVVDESFPTPPSSPIRKESISQITRFALAAWLIAEAEKKSAS